MNDEQENPASGGKALRIGVLCAVIAGVAFVGGLWIGGNNTGSVLANVPFIGDSLNATPDQTADLSDFWKAWNTLSSKFVETHASSSIPVTKDKLWGAIAGLAASYGDPYTVFFPPSEAKVFQDDISGNFDGVGMELGENAQGILTVIAPLKDTPAAKAGIKSGDEILAINGTTTENMSTDEAVQKIRGPKGSTVTFKILRAGKTLDIPVMRDTINVPVIDDSLDKASGVYTIALYTFTQNSSVLFDKALGNFRASGSHKLLIDLRGDPGGYLDAAVGIASHFLPKSAVVVTEDYKGKQENIVHTSDGTGGLPAGTTVAILIDQGSASASEILAGALQDNKVATLIGTRSFGKGSVQELIGIDGGSLKVTVARWLTPLGRSISDGGLTPDIKVDLSQADVTAGKDPQKDRALQFLSTGK